MRDYDSDPRDIQVVPVQPPALQMQSPMSNLDAQIVAARHFPRDEIAVIAKITSLVTIDEESAEECLYALVRGSKKKKRNGSGQDEENKPIEGPSIRLAEIAAQKYGNCRIEARVVEVNRIEKYVEAEGIFLDLETNMASKASVRRRISTSGGFLFSDDMIIVTGNAACAIAKRNAILAGIPRAIYRPAYNAARKMIAGDAETLPQRRAEAVKAFAFYGVKEEQLLDHLGVESVADITAENIVTLRGMFGSLKRQEATVEEMFAPEKREVDKDYDPLNKAAAVGKEEKLTDEQMDAFFSEGKAAKAAGQAAEPPEGYSPAAAKIWLNGFNDE